VIVSGILPFFAGVLAFAPAGSIPVPDRPPADSAFSFVVVGHVRRDGTGGIIHPRLGEMIERVRRLHPDLVFLTGDMVWGDVDHNPADTVKVEAEWRALDSALAGIGAPVYRVPGNHDISDLGTRDLFFRRYGKPPHTLEFRGSRFLLLASPWIPPDGDTRHNPFIRPAGLDSTEINFLKTELARPQKFAHTFVMEHHILWWQPNASWWQDVHPLLARNHVDAVFGGDYGPLKFSYLEKDSVQYYQSAMEGDVSLGILRKMMSSRLLAQQFDNFLYVTVNGPAVNVEVRTVGETSSGKFGPDHWRAVNDWHPPEPPLYSRVWQAIRSPARLAMVILIIGCIFLVGMFTGSRMAKRSTRS
jgi:hypothetical protein